MAQCVLGKKKALILIEAKATCRFRSYEDKYECRHKK